MSIETAIHERWQSYRPLTDKIPASSLQTGWSAPGAMPYCVVQRVGDSDVLTPSGDVRLETSTIEFGIHSNDLDLAKGVARAIVDRFDRKSFNYSEGKVVVMLKQSGGEEMQEDGSWTVTADYTATTQE